VSANNTKDGIIAGFIAGLIEFFGGSGIAVPPLFNPFSYFAFTLLLHSILKMPFLPKGCNSI
jgi:hypothetical protein